jgi:hypothetical protein
MPVILPPETREQWLSGESGKEILRPFPTKRSDPRPISKRINKPKNNDPSVLEEGEIEHIRRLILIPRWRRTTKNFWSPSVHRITSTAEINC